MPITQRILLEIPTFILGLIVVGGAVILTLSGLLIVRHFIPHSRLK